MVTIMRVSPDKLTRERADKIVGMTISFCYDCGKAGGRVYPQKMTLDRVYGEGGTLALQGSCEAPSVRKWLRATVSQIVGPITVEVEN